MAEADPAVPIKALEKLAEEKQRLASTEKELVERLNGVLQRLGYRIVSTRTDQAGMPRRRGRPPKNLQAVIAGAVVKRRGRPPGSKNKPKRRGRPPKAKSQSGS